MIVMSKDLGTNLTGEMEKYLNAEKANAVLATLRPGDGWPHTTPIYLIKVKNSGQLLFALAAGHQASANLLDNGKAMLSIMGEKDQAYSIEMKVRQLKPAMDGNAAMSAFIGDITAIKSDTTPTVIVEAGVKAKYRSDKTEAFFRMMFDELVKEGKK